MTDPKLNKPYLYLDDMRSPGDSAQYMTGKEGLYHDSDKWAIVRNTNQFVSYLDLYVSHNHRLPELISFDHDLAEEHYYEAPISNNEYNKKYKNFKESTGLNCAYYLINKCKEYELGLPICFSHSMNPIGRQNILDLLSDYQNGKNINQLDKRFDSQ